MIAFNLPSYIFSIPIICINSQWYLEDLKILALKDSNDLDFNAFKNWCTWKVVTHPNEANIGSQKWVLSFKFNHKLDCLIAHIKLSCALRLMALIT